MRCAEGIIEVIDEFYSANLSRDTIRGMKENTQHGDSATSERRSSATNAHQQHMLRLEVEVDPGWEGSPDREEGVRLRSLLAGWASQASIC